MSMGLGTGLGFFLSPFFNADLPLILVIVTSCVIQGVRYIYKSAR